MSATGFALAGALERRGVVVEPPPVAVAAAVIVRDDRVLACQRRADAAHPGRWEFPGGKLEAGESLPDCLRRELREELGIEAEVGVELLESVHQYPGRAPVRITFFAVDRYRGELANLDFAEIRWFDPLELDTLDLLEADRPMAALLRSGSGPG